MTEGASRLLRRLPILVVAGLLAWLLLGDRPRHVDLEWVLDEPGPVRVEVELRKPGGPVDGSITWGDGKDLAAPRQVEHAILNTGSYKVEATLLWPDGRRQTVERDLEVGKGDDRIVIHLR